MSVNTVKSARLGEEYIRVEHPSGLTLLLYPMQGFTSSYALFATKYGSVDNSFRRSDESDFTTVPAGIAHFLEHKMFACKDGDAFARYAKTGASANAYTSFDKTAYLFSCTDKFEESLRILLEFVTEPYFTQPSVDKEQGIIGQEIRMFDDDPDWQVFFNLLGAMYKNHPLRIDIAGTTETIAQIDADLLYHCYDSFYNLHNMVLSIAGGFDPDTVIRLCDEILSKAEPIMVERAVIDEPRTVDCRRIEVSMPVSTPMFQIGYKGVAGSEEQNFKNQVLDELLIDLIAGESTPLYRRLYDAGMINNTFGGEVFCGRDYISIIFSGESRNPKAVYDEISAEIERMQVQGISPEDFERGKKALYGRYIAVFSSARPIATLMMESHFYGTGLYSILDIVSELTLEQLERRFKETVNTANSAISIVNPI